MLFAAARRKAELHRIYDQFEQGVSAILLLFVSIIIVYAMVLVAIAIVHDLTDGVHFVQAALKDTFGLILSVLILIEFNHSIALALRQRTGVIQARVIVLITIIVIARKLILLDYGNVSLETLLGLGGLALALGLLYWLLSDIERRRGLPAGQQWEQPAGGDRETDR